jgi:hypothetical protein
MNMATQSAEQALLILRDTGQFQWYVIPFLLIVLYIYAIEIEKKNWNGILAALAFWGMDWINEIWNALVFKANQYAAVWMAPGDTAFLILIGLNIEITMMFAIMGIVSTKMLPPNSDQKIKSIPKWVIFAGINSIACVIVEIILNLSNALIWEYSWWSIQSPWLIWVIGYMPFWLMAYWIYHMKEMKKKVITVSIIWAIIAISLIVFMGILKWI